MNNIFKAVKDAISTREVASFYGIKVSHNGMCCCPFHKDKHPSMKIDNRYHCFGCGEDGDVINFVGKLYGLSSYDAAVKIITDFNLDIPITNNGITATTPKPNGTTSLNVKSNSYNVQRAFQEYKRDALLLLHRYLDFLHKAERDFAPASPEDLEQPHPFFEEALMKKDFIDWLIDELTFGDITSQLELLTTYGGTIEYVKNRLSKIKY